MSKLIRSTWATLLFISGLAFGGFISGSFADEAPQTVNVEWRLYTAPSYCGACKYQERAMKSLGMEHGKVIKIPYGGKNVMVKINVVRLDGDEEVPEKIQKEMVTRGIPENQVRYQDKLVGEAVHALGSKTEIARFLSPRIQQIIEKSNK